MGCPRRGEWRAFLDHEVPSKRRIELERHLAACRRCQSGLTELERGEALLARALASEAPQRALGSTLDSAALVRQAAIRNKMGWRRLDMNKMQRVGQSLRPAVVALMLVAVFVGVYSFAPTRAWARDMLGFFRVRKFTVIRLDPIQANQAEAVAEQLGDTLFAQEPQVLADEPEVQVADLAAAQSAAGFAVLAPIYTGGAPITSFYVKGHTALGMDVKREGLETLLGLAGMDPNQLAADFSQGTVRVEFRSSVRMTSELFELVQVWQPVAEYPAELDPALLGEAGLRLMGIPEREAHRLATTIDWTDTLVVPVPSDLVEITDVEIGGSPGLLMMPHGDTESEGYGLVLVWHRDDVLYALSTKMGQQRTVEMAESLF